jgi:hypothetical protein
MTHTHNEIVAHLERFAASISPSLTCFVTMFQEKLFKLEAQGDDDGIEAVYDLME